MWLNYTMGWLMANGSEGFHWVVAGMLEHLKKMSSEQIEVVFGCEK